MKTVIILIISFLIMGKGYAQESNPDTTQLTKEVIYKDVKSALKELGDALKVGAEHVYVVLIKQQVVKSVINIVIYILLIGMIFLGYNQCRLTYNAHLNLRKNSDYEWEIGDSAKGITSIILGVITGISFIFFLVGFINTIGETVTGFINPEYGAMKEIMDFIKAK